MNKCLFGFALALSLSAFAPQGHAQTVESTRSRAFVVNGLLMIGVPAGFYGSINPEFQLHRENRFGGHALNLGAAFTLWPNEFGPSAAATARYQYDQQLVPGTPFFVSPYVGVNAGLGIFNIINGGEPRFRFIATAVAGLDVKLIFAQRMLLGFRPIGIMVPVFFGGPVVTALVIYDIAITLGFTY
jgi:hypothetical protein